MADALSVLRQYWTGKKDILEKDDQIIFAEYAWPKNTKSNYIKYGAKDGGDKEYYTLDCILFLLRNENLSHPMYVKQAAAASVPVVVRPDRKDLLAYMNGETPTSTSIDKSAPLEIAMQRPVPVKRPAEDAIESDKKKARTEGAGDLMGMMRNDENKLMPSATSKPSEIVESLSVAKISALREKRLKMRRGMIKIGEDELGSGPAVESDIDVMRDIVAKERQWRTRTTALQSVGKRFDKNIFGILQALKAREEGVAKSHQHREAQQPQDAAPARQAPLTPYNRFIQERFKGKDEASEYNIDTMGTYHGRTLRNLTSESSRRPQPQPGSGSTRPSKTPPPSSTGELRPAAEARASPGGSGGSAKRSSKTPIIIIPAATTSLITMFNARDLLQDLKLVSTEEKRNSGVKRENEVLLQRRKDGSTLTVPYRVTDNPNKLSKDDWERVVAVFVQGPAWQFKGWPWGSNPVEIFSRIKAYHLKYLEMPLDNNVQKWAVQIINLERHKRHKDRSQLITFWESLDRHMAKNKPFLRF